MVGVTAYGINSQCALYAEGFLRDKGYEMIAFTPTAVAEWPWKS